MSLDDADDLRCAETAADSGLVALFEDRKEEARDLFLESIAFSLVQLNKTLLHYVERS